MGQLRYLTAGESHGQGLVGIIEGIPAGLEIHEDDIFHQLQRRQLGYGRGGRMKIETDRARILSGVRFGKTLGSPIAMFIENKDWKNWQTKMSVEEIGEAVKKVTVPRPGHADLAGSIKYGQDDIRNILERASARETAMRVALAAIARKFLAEFGIHILSHVTQIYHKKSAISFLNYGNEKFKLPCEISEVNAFADKSPVRCLDTGVEAEMIQSIEFAKKQGDTVGGIFEVCAVNVPVGLGSHIQWDRKLDARIGAAMMSIPAMKGVEIGLGFSAAAKFGSEVHDPIHFDESRQAYSRPSNHAGGLEGGITNGMPLVVRVAMKPISTLMKPLDSVDMQTKENVQAHIERSDYCAVPAASVIGEAMLSLVLADACLEKFGGDAIQEILQSFHSWQQNASQS